MVANPSLLGAYGSGNLAKPHKDRMNRLGKADLKQ